MKIGLFGGTFNPIHYGHLRGAEEVREIFSLDKIIFIPSGIPPLKGSEVIEGIHRYNMVKLAVENNPYFEVSDYEIKLKEPSYTVNTLDHFKKLYRDHTLFFIIGVDALLDIPRWHKPRELLKKVDFIVMERPNFDIKKIDFTVEDESEGVFRILNSERRLFYVKVSPNHLSSTYLRDLVRRGKSLRYLTPDRVIDYINSHNLYRE